MEKSASRGNSTRDALIQAATAVFAERGYHAVTTRLLAHEAGVNQALIGYHFGSKEGLYLAVFDDIADRMKQRMGPLAQDVRNMLATSQSIPEDERRELYLSELLRIVDTMVVLMLSDQTRHWAQLIIREQQSPTLAFERIYCGFMSSMFGLVTELVRRLRGELDDTRVRLIVVQILGNVLVWRTSRTGVLRQMGWEGFEDEQVDLVRASVQQSVEALVFAQARQASRRPSP